MLFRIDRYMYLFLAIQEIVSKATCESNKDTNKQTTFCCCKAKEAERQQQRIHTPPPLTQADPDTPKKGNKRTAKPERWEPLYEEVQGYIVLHRLCRKCFRQGHKASKCTSGYKEVPIPQ